MEVVRMTSFAAESSITNCTRMHCTRACLEKLTRSWAKTNSDMFDSQIMYSIRFKASYLTTNIKSSLGGIDPKRLSPGGMNM